MHTAELQLKAKRKCKYQIISSSSSSRGVPNGEGIRGFICPKLPCSFTSKGQDSKCQVLQVLNHTSAVYYMGMYNDIFTSANGAKEVMFCRCLSVCLSVCWQLCAKTSERICMKFSGQVGNGTVNKCLKILVAIRIRNSDMDPA